MSRVVPAETALAGRIIAAGLGLVGGFVDAYGYLRWHTFGANMTGNTVIFAVSLFKEPERAFFPLTLVVAFVSGSVLGRVLVDRSSPAIGLLGEAVLLSAAAFGGYPALGLIALAMGIQNSSVAMFSGVRANTSFISGDYSRLAEALADIISLRTRRDTWRTLSVLAPLLGAYVLGALGAMCCSTFWYEVLFMVPVVLVIAYTIYRGP